MNKTYNDKVREGYQYVGISEEQHRSSREIVRAMADKYNVMGNKIAVVTKIDVSPRRGGGPDNKYYYFVALVKFTDEYKAWLASERERMNKERHEQELMKLADALSMEDITYMLNYKLARLTLNTNQEVKEN